MRGGASKLLCVERARGTHQALSRPGEVLVKLLLAFARHAQQAYHRWPRSPLRRLGADDFLAHFTAHKDADTCGGFRRLHQQFNREHSGSIHHHQPSHRPARPSDKLLHWRRTTTHSHAFHDSTHSECDAVSAGCGSHCDDCPSRADWCVESLFRIPSDPPSDLVPPQAGVAPSRSARYEHGATDIVCVQ